MRRPVLVTALLAVLALGLSGCPQRRLMGEGPVERVVTLTPSSTELVWAAGGGARLVGVDSFSSYPPEVAGLPRVGDFLGPSIEAILALRPDLVVLDEVQHATADKLAVAGIRTLVLGMHRLDDVRTGLSQVAVALGDPAGADRAIAELDAALTGLRARAATRAGRPRVLLVVDRQLGGLRGLVAAGPGSYLDELLALAGGVNVLAAAGTRYVKLAADRVVGAAPEVILDATHGGALDDWREIARVPAVAGGRTHPLSDGSFLAPTPRAAEAALRLEGLLYPR